MPRREWAGSSRFLSDLAEAERAFALADQLGSVNAAAAELGTTWPSLRKAFTCHGLGMPARNPEAVRQRAVAVTNRRAGQRAAPPLDPVFVVFNAAQLPPARGPAPSTGCGCAAPRRPRRSVIAPWSNSTPRAGSPWAAGGHHHPPARTCPTAGQRPGRSRRPQQPQPTPQRAAAAAGGEGDADRCPIGRSCPASDQGEPRFRADLAVYLTTWFIHGLAGLPDELPEPTRMALMHELCEVGPAWARLPASWPVTISTPPPTNPSADRRWFGRDRDTGRDER